MMIIPAIDLKDGHSVRLYQGDYAKQMLVAQVPEEQAKAIDEAGLNALHLVDLTEPKPSIRSIRKRSERFDEISKDILNLAAESGRLKIFRPVLKSELIE